MFFFSLFNSFYNFEQNGATTFIFGQIPNFFMNGSARDRVQGRRGLVTQYPDISQASVKTINGGEAQFSLCAGENHFSLADICYQCTR